MVWCLKLRESLLRMNDKQKDLVLGVKEPIFQKSQCFTVAFMLSSRHGVEKSLADGWSWICQDKPVILLPVY